METYFEIIGEIGNIEVIAVKHSIRELARLQKRYGKARWRKLKGIALVQLPNGQVHRAELHWYEAHGVGKRQIKLKQLLD